MAGFFFREGVDPDPEALVIRDRSPAESVGALRRCLSALEGAPAWNAIELEAALRPLADELGLSAKQLFAPLRMAITGQAVSPPLFDSIEIIGRSVGLQRVDRAIRILQAM